MTTPLLIQIPYRADTTTYVERILHLPYCIFFDSGQPVSTRGRYDIFCAAPLYTLNMTEGLLTHPEHPPRSLTGQALLSQLNQDLKNACPNPVELPSEHLPFYGGFAGYFSYDLVRFLSADRRWQDLPQNSLRDIGIPELLLGFYSWAGIVDHQEKKAFLSFLPNCPDFLKNQIQILVSDQNSSSIFSKKFNLINKMESYINVDSYKKSLAKIQKYITDGDCYQVNYAQRFSAKYQGSPWQAYKTLRREMPAPFGAYFAWNNNELAEDSAILCFSPERFLQVNGKTVMTQPIKGTITRGADRKTDEINARLLLDSDKNRAENLMIVDLLRNDLSKCCTHGSVKVEKLFELQSVSNVHHLVSTVTGTLKDGVTAFDLLQATLPGGSITGAPKLRAAEIIDELEPSQRSIYCGALGYININGDMDTNIAIRTVLCHDNTAYCWGGGGIVADSEWEQEYQESLVKIYSLLSALESQSQV